MNATVIASSLADAQAGDAIREHHAQMSGALSVKVAAVGAGADRGSATEARAALADLASWCQSELLPHARAEEETLYAAARSQDQARLLVTAMSAEHEALGRLVATLSAPQATLTAAIAATGALNAMFDSHVAKENDLLVPLLESTPDVSLAALLEQMHDRLGPADEVAPAAAGHACGCGSHDDPGFPVLDAQSIPHAIRHATIFGALGAVQPGEGLVLLAPHDPLPLLSQLEQAQPGRFEVGYLERGPQTWSLQFTRRA